MMLVIQKYFARISYSGRKIAGSPIFPYFFILFFALITHGLLLLNDGIYWDDWVWFDLRNNTYYWDRIFSASVEMGSMPYEKYFGYLFSVFPDRVFASKFFVFISIVITGILLFQISQETGYFNRLESLFIAIIGIVYPANRTQVFMSTAFYSIYIAVFLIACLIALKKERFVKYKIPSFFLRIVSLILFFISFGLNSLLVIFYCYLILLFFCFASNYLKNDFIVTRAIRISGRNMDYWVIPAFYRLVKKITFPLKYNGKKHNITAVKSAPPFFYNLVTTKFIEIGIKAVRFFFSHVDYVLLPFFYWFIKRFFFFPSGFYKNYNLIDLQKISPSFLQMIGKIIKVGVTDQFSIMFDLMRLVFAWLNVPFLLYIFGALAALMVVWALIRKKAIDNKYYFLLFGPLLFGMMLFAGAVFPYIATGKIPSLYGVDTRHAVLLVFPLAILFVSLTRIFFRDVDSHLSITGATLLVFPIIGFVMIFIQSYLNWEVIWIKNLSIMHQFGQMEGVEDISVYRIDDQLLKEDEDIPQFYEWSGMFSYVYGNQKTIGTHYLDSWDLLTNYGRRFFIERYNLEDFDPYGCEALLTVFKGPSVTNRKSLNIVATYYYLKFFKSEGDLDGFLSQVTVLSVIRFDSPVARHCPSHVFPKRGLIVPGDLP